MKNTNIKIIKLTPEYLYKKGQECYSKGLQLEAKNFKQQEEFTNAILYFQGAMILGHEDACAYLSEFFSSENHLGINDESLSSFTKIMGTIGKLNNYFKIRDSVCLKNYNINNNKEFQEYIMIEKIYEDIFKTNYSKDPVPEDLVLFNVKAIIKDFNSKLPAECHLLTDGSIFECIEEIATFTVLELAGDLN